MEKQDGVILDITIPFQESYVTKVKHNLKKVTRNITVEPVILFYAIGIGITAIITPSVYFEKICKVNFQPNLSNACVGINILKYRFCKSCNFYLHRSVAYTLERKIKLGMQQSVITWTMGITVRNKIMYKR